MKKINKIVFSLIMCVIVTFFNLRLYYKELEKKKDGENGNCDAKKRGKKEGEMMIFIVYTNRKDYF